jgi:hypothetical protein
MIENRVQRTIGCAALALLIAACAAHRGRAGMPVVDLAGTWVLNAGQSETPELGERGGRSGIVPQRRIGVGVRPRIGPGPGPSRGLDDALAELRGVVQALHRGSARLEIAHSNAATTVTFADTTSLYLRNNGARIRTFWRGVDEVEARGRWRGSAFVIERRLEIGLEVRETITRATSSAQLVVQTVIEGSPLREVKFKRVYDRATQ